MLRSGKHAVKEINDHKWRWSTICFLHGWLLATMWFQTGLNFTLLVTGLAEAALCILTTYLLVAAVLKPGRFVHEWALEEHTKDTMMSLRGNTSEELETLLKYHMDNGHIDEAERCSHRLLAMAEGNPMPDMNAPAAPRAIGMNGSDPGVKLKITTALPGWMNDGKEEQETEPADSASLPDWMRKS